MKFVGIVLLLISGVLSHKIQNGIRPGFPTGRIINGQEAKKHEAPFIVSMHNGPTGSHFCGGSIIRKDAVATAAHCVINTVGNIYVTAGLHNHNNKDEGQTRKVVKIIVHEGYGGGVGPNDIALLILEKSFEIDNKTVSIIDLHTDEVNVDGLKGIVFGWGKDTHWGALPSNLQKVLAGIIYFVKCKPMLPKDAPITEVNVCSSSENQGISACNGDSGGPYITHINSVPKLVGIVSWGYVPCGISNLPSVYTKVAAFNSWINNNLAIN